MLRHVGNMFMKKSVCTACPAGRSRNRIGSASVLYCAGCPIPDRCLGEGNARSAALGWRALRAPLARLKLARYTAVLVILLSVPVMLTPLAVAWFYFKASHEDDSTRELLSQINREFEHELQVERQVRAELRGARRGPGAGRGVKAKYE